MSLAKATIDFCVDPGRCRNVLYRGQLSLNAQFEKQSRFDSLSVLLASLAYMWEVGEDDH